MGSDPAVGKHVIPMLAVAFGAATGALGRYGISLWAAQRFGTFPVGTLIVNLLGSFLIGLLAALFATRFPVVEHVRLLLLTGFLGGFTTFSSFSYEAYALVTAGRWSAALIYVVGSVGCGLLAVVLGVVVARL